MKTIPIAITALALAFALPVMAEDVKPMEGDIEADFSWSSVDLSSIPAPGGGSVVLTETREIGRPGISASAIGLGTWAIGGWMWGGTDGAASIAAIRAAVDAGVSLIDTAPAYGMGRSEEIVGKAIAGHRDEVVLATKRGLVWHTAKGNHFFNQDGKPVNRHLGRISIAHELEESLHRLGTDHIDLYITHWQDPTTPIAETMDALEGV